MLFVVQLVMKVLFVGLATALFSAAGHGRAVCSAGHGRAVCSAGHESAVCSAAGCASAVYSATDRLSAVCSAAGHIMVV